MGTKKGDVWVALNGLFLNVSKFLSQHPDGELAVLTFAGKDATAEFDMIHPPDVVEKYAPDAITGVLGDGGEEDNDEEDDSSEGGYTMEEVAKHNKKGDVWVVLNGRVLNVSNFLLQHPGGELAILTFAGKDATAEFDMIPPPDVIEKYAPDAVIGAIGTGGESASVPAAGVSAVTPVAASVVGGSRAKDYTKANKNRNDRMDGYGKVSYPIIGPFIYMVLNFMKEIIFTIFGQKNIVLTNDRVGLSRSAIFLFVFVIIHAVGNLHVFLGPRDFNGYGYFYARLYWTGFGFQANIVEEYVLLSALLHVAVALKRTWDISLNYSVASGKLNMAISGVTLLTFMTIHLFQFRFGDTKPYDLCPPEYLVNI